MHGSQRLHRDVDGGVDDVCGDGGGGAVVATSVLKVQIEKNQVQILITP